MTLLLWGLGLVLLALNLAAGREGPAARRDPERSYPVRPPAAESAWIAAPAARSVTRPAMQTGAAILAVALALDVSAGSQAWSPPSGVELVHGIAAIDLPQAPDAQGLLDLAAYAPAPWTDATLATDGWFV